MADNLNGTGPQEQRFTILDLNYVSLYYEDFRAAVDFYTRVFGPAENVDAGGEIVGWRMGSTWLTLFPSKEAPFPGSNPRNTEFAIQVEAPDEVDALYQAFIDAGAKKGWEPFDAEMYEAMRFCNVDDPFGVRIDVICPIENPGT
ncbi:MAG: VOC family protein [Anaerolineales bacterium]|nr:VOC family protein [Anaerolineales bacterium]